MEVLVLVAAPTAYICDLCIDTCVEIVKEEREKISES